LNSDRTLVQIRERTFLDILDLAMVVVRERPVTLGIAAVVGVAPFAALNAWLVSSAGIKVSGLIPLLLMEVPWATAPLTMALGGMMFGERPSADRMLRTFLRSIPSMLLHHVVVRGFLVLIPLLYFLIPARLAFLDEVILLERIGIWSALRRGAVLCLHRGGELFGQWLAQLFFGAAFVACFWLGTEALARALTQSELTWEQPGASDLLDLRFHGAVWLAIAFFGVVRFLTYIDQRIRLEGWEVKLRLRAVGQLLEDAQRW